MHAVPENWIEFYSQSSVFKIRIDFKLKNSVRFSLYSDNIKMSSLKVEDSIVDVNSIKPGALTAKCLSFTLMNPDGMFDDIDFMDAFLRLYFIQDKIGVSTCRYGLFHVTESLFKGNTIEITAYDDLALEKYNKADINGISLSSYSSAGSAVGNLFFHHAIHSTMPNEDYPLPNITVGAEGSPLPKDITRRDLVQYICEICGAYGRTDYGVIDWDTDPFEYIYFFPLPRYDFTQNIDGGTFWVDTDDADGGLFSAPFVTNYASVIDGAWEEEEEQVGSGVVYQVSFDGTGGAMTFNGFDLTGSYHTEAISDTFHIPVGAYLFGSDSTSTQFDVMLRNDTQGISYVPVNNGTVQFYCDNATDNYTIYIRTKPNFTQSAITFSPILTDKPFMGQSAMQMVWKPSPMYDGGLFVFWEIDSPTVYPLEKVMENPYASERKMVTKVRVSGNGYDDVEVGTDEGETIEIKDNPLIVTQTDANNVANNVLSVVYGLTYYVCDVSLSADPRFEPGDMVSFKDRRGNDIITICTTFNYNHEDISHIS